MAISLLTYANRAKVAEALTAGGYPVTRVTVNRWARGGEMPGIAAQMILELFGHTADTTEAPPPEWAKALEKRLRLELRLNRALIESVDPDEIERMRLELHAEIPVERLPDEDDPPEAPRPRDASPGIAQ